jgi:hypothetical protein
VGLNVKLDACASFGLPLSTAVLIAVLAIFFLLREVDAWKYNETSGIRKVRSIINARSLRELSDPSANSEGNNGRSFRNCCSDLRALCEVLSRSG